MSKLNNNTHFENNSRSKCSNEQMVRIHNYYGITMWLEWGFCISYITIACSSLLKIESVCDGNALETDKSLWFSNHINLYISRKGFVVHYMYHSWISSVNIGLKQKKNMLHFGIV